MGERRTGRGKKKKRKKSIVEFILGCLSLLQTKFSKKRKESGGYAFESIEPRKKKTVCKLSTPPPFVPLSCHVVFMILFFSVFVS